MYESPIALTAEEIQSILEDEVLKVTKKIGIDVDKDELIKALKYDRGQYEKGYADAKAEQKKGKWLSHYDYCKRKGCTPSGLSAYWWCDQCEHGVEYPTNFCPNCGAEMKGE